MKEKIEQVKDVVCGMQINPAEAAVTTKYGWKTYHFCSQGCFQKFSKEPETFAEKDPGGDVPEGRSEKSGSCCGDAGACCTV